MMHSAGAGSGIGVLKAYAPLLGPAMGNIAARFDILAFDRRGFGGTAPFSCIDSAWIDKLRAAPVEPQTDTEWAAADAVWQEYADHCSTALEPRGWLGTEQVARDVDAIRIALGESKTTLLTYGYSGLVAAEYAALFPDKLRAAAIDDSVNAPESDLVKWMAQRAAAGDALLSEFFAACASDATCAFHGGTSAQEVAQAYDTLDAKIHAAPLDVGGRLLGKTDFDAAVERILDGGAGFLDRDLAPMVKKLAPLLASAESGDGGPLLQGADAHFGRAADGSYETAGDSATPDLELTDHPCPAAFDIAAAKTAWAEVHLVAPRLGAFLMSQALVCLHGQGRATPIDVHAPDAPPLVLFAGAHNALKPLGASQDLATALGNGSEVVEFDGYGDVTISRSQCIRDSMSQLLLDPAGWSPPPGNVCP